MSTDRAVLTLIVLLIVAAAVPAALPRHAPELRFLDVGQGDAILVQQGTIQMLVDGGPDANVLSGIGDAMPFFDRHVEFVVVTHPDLDHFGGLIDVLSRYSVGTVLLSGADDDTEAYRRFRDMLASNGAEAVIVSAGDRIALTDRVEAVVLWPATGHATDDQNDLSVMLRVDIDGEAVAVLTGDATTRVEAVLVDDDALVRTPVLKAGHHGSRSSTSAAFLDALDPALAVISVGERNRYGHPATATLSRLKTRGISIIRTDTSGTVRVVMNGGLRSCTGPPPFLSRCRSIE